MIDLYEDETINYKNYGIDGDIVPVSVDKNHDGVITPGIDYVYLFFGLRRGGTNYYALDVTDKYKPKLKWVKSFDNGGQSWSPPVATRIDVANSGQSSDDDLVLVIGGGYDTVHDQASHPESPDSEGAAIIIVDAENGKELWRASGYGDSDLNLATMTRAIPSAVRVLDMSGDGFADRMYAADLGGQVLRFDVISGNNASNLVTGGVIARLGAEGLYGTLRASPTRDVSTQTPDVAMVQDIDKRLQRRYLSLSMGSGYRAHPLDKRASDRFYSLRDKDVFTKLSQPAYNAYPVIYDSELKEISGRINVELDKYDRGWKFTLPYNEKILAESRTFDNTIYFVSFEPDVASSDPCQAGLSINRLYRVAVSNGDPVTDDLDELDEFSEEDIDEARVTKLEQGGIAVRPIFLFPSPVNADCEGADCAPPPVGCVGCRMFRSGLPE